MRAKIRRGPLERHPSRGGALLGLLLLGACASAGLDSRWRGDAEWFALDINGVPVSGTAPTLRLGDGRATGNGGCNSFSAGFRTQSRERVTLTGLSSTRKACDPAVMEQESRYFSILQNVQGYNFYASGDFSLIAGDGRAVRFRRR